MTKQTLTYGVHRIPYEVIRTPSTARKVKIQVQPDASVQAHVFEFPDGSYYALAGGYWPSFNVCVVDLDDLQNFVVFWLDSGAGIPADIDNSGFVDLVDFSDLNFYWLGLCPANWPL